MLPPSRQARGDAARQLESEQTRSRAWLAATAACALLILTSPFLFPPLAVLSAALTALSASRWRHHDRVARALSRRRATRATRSNGTRPQH